MLTFSISYLDLIKFLYFADTTERGDRGRKQRGIGGWNRGWLYGYLYCTKRIEAWNPGCFWFGKMVSQCQLLLKKIIFRICHLLVYMVVARYQTSLIQLPLSSCWIHVYSPTSLASCWIHVYCPTSLASCWIHVYCPTSLASCWIHVYCPTSLASFIV